jgi:hypothetical protein
VPLGALCGKCRTSKCGICPSSGPPRKPGCPTKQPSELATIRFCGFRGGRFKGVMPIYNRQGHARRTCG